MEISMREKTAGHNGNKVRRRGSIPGVLYGKGLQNIMFEVSELELNEEIHKKGEHGFLETSFMGEIHKTIVKEVQRDPLSRKIIHIDLEDIKGDKEVTSNVPINFIGEESIGKTGAVLQKEKKSLKVRCTPDKLPKTINLNITGAQVGSVFKISDIEAGEEISILDNLETVIAAVSYEKKTISIDMELKEEEIREKRETR